MTDPSGPRTLILLRARYDSPQDLEDETRACVEFIRDNELPDYIGPIVDESMWDQPLWTTPAGMWFWTLAGRASHVVVYNVRAFSRSRRDRRDCIKRVLDKGLKLYQAGPPVMEITDEVLMGMILDTPEVKKTRRIPRWGKRMRTLARHGVRYEVFVDDQAECELGNQIIGRILLGTPAGDVLAWLKSTPRLPSRWPSERWEWETVRRVLKSYVGDGHDAYKKWMSMRRRKACKRMWR